ncbi:MULTISPECIES: 3-keto-disaccharide hydrolase [unclassified Saccharicrinis]|uniref:3-keto-disaccharide hydrolase n=1 Tax=unclassified Saccharicrinis TaxID=2646859 RepID=UPI003D33C307
MCKVNMIWGVFILSVTLSCGLNSSIENRKKDKEWKYLFNGKNLDGWVVKLNHHKLGDNYANTFRVVDGKIQVNYDGYNRFDERFGHLFYYQPFSSYHLKFEYRFTDQWLNDAPVFTFRNSGVMFHSQDPKTILKEQNWPISVEYQLLAEETEGEQRPTGNVCTPGTNIVFNGKKDSRHCIKSTSSTYKWDQWISVELIVKGGSVFHIVEGDTVLHYSNPSIGGGVVKGYDPRVKIDGKPLTDGYIGLQSEGQGVEFSEIKIKEL